MHVIALVLWAGVILAIPSSLSETASYSVFATQNTFFDNSAAGITLPIFELLLAEKNVCGFYKVPDEKKPGVLFITDKNKKCKKSFLEKRIFESREVFNFKFIFEKSSLILFLDKEKLVINMPNLKHAAPQLFRAPQRSFVRLGSTQNAMKIDNGELCLRVDNNCSASLNTCSRCKNSSYEIVASGCFKKYSRVCGVNNCGRKGQPACIRGASYPHVSVKNYCQNNSPYGFCQQGSDVICENGTLVCN